MVLAFNCSGMQESTETIRFYVGSFDGSLEYAIYLCELDPVNEKLAVLDSFSGAKGPSYLDFSPDRRTLYSIDSEVSDPDKNQMSVSSFRINRDNLDLEFLNSQSSEGSGPCHIHCSNEGDYLFTANYSSGHVASFPVSEDGRIEPASSVVIGEGTGPDLNRQGGPHTHQVMLAPDGNYLLVPDLGADKVLVFALDPSGGILSPNPSQPFFKLAPGSGPRHLVFHPSGEFVYVVNELNSTVTACSYQGGNGVLTELQTTSTVEESHQGSKYPAAIRMHPGGGTLYASTRGDNSSIGVFRIEENGKITRIQVVEGVPHWPRDFNIDPSGNLLLVAGERADRIRLYKISQKNGMLTGTEATLALPAPGCILFIPQ